jgi:ArsR family transcriptional regulator
VRALNLLATSNEPVCICNLVEPLGLSQPTVSHHMKKLLEAGVVEREQRGKWAYFSLKRDAVEKLAAVADLKGVMR